MTQEIHITSEHTLREKAVYALEQLKKQGEQSFNDEGNCAYRGVGGCKCLIGHLIRDEDYSPDMENLDFIGVSFKFDNLYSTDPSNPNYVSNREVYFYRDLQQFHDYADKYFDFSRMDLNSERIQDLLLIADNIDKGRKRK